MNEEEIEHDVHEGKEIHDINAQQIHIINENGHAENIHFKIDGDSGARESHNIIIRHKIDIDQDSIKSPLIIINGNETTDYTLENISPHHVKTIEVVHGKSAKEKYGKNIT